MTSYHNPAPTKLARPALSANTIDDLREIIRRESGLTLGDADLRRVGMSLLRVYRLAAEALESERAAAATAPSKEAPT